MTEELTVYVQNKTSKIKPISVSLWGSDFIHQKWQLGKVLSTYYYVFLFRTANLISKVKHFPRASFIVFSPAIFKMRQTTCFRKILVVNIGTSLQISYAKWDLGTAKWTFCSSERFRNPCKYIISGNHLKSFMNIISAFPAPIKAYLELDGLVNVSKIVVIGLNCFSDPCHLPSHFSTQSPWLRRIIPADSTFRTAFNFILSLFKLPCFWYHFSVYTVRVVSNKNF